MTATCTGNDYWQFLRSWMADPGRVAAIAPSSEALSRLMTRGIAPAEGPVLELGAGTGVFTRALLSRGVPEDDLTLVECGPDFARVLRHRFPRARVLAIDAADLARHPLRPRAPLAAAISGLPLLAMSTEKVGAILAAVFLHLRPNGRLYQFTYGLTCPVPNAVLGQLGLEARRIGYTFRNVPPASVYRIARRLPLETIVPASQKIAVTGGSAGGSVHG